MEDSIMPKDFRKKDFGRALRGYSVDEVDKYLD
ncbi:MAG: DivIVA domain-containing protein, partial [Clostridia bacterium]|nr:DivIVA domain-containing protein [Clostridia bacterium]